MLHGHRPGGKRGEGVQGLRAQGSGLRAQGEGQGTGLTVFGPEAMFRSSYHWQKEPPMLLLTRRTGEEIVVIDKESGEEIVIVVRLRENRQIGVGIEAPRPRFEIYRREVLERKLAAETAAQ